MQKYSTKPNAKATVNLSQAEQAIVLNIHDDGLLALKGSQDKIQTLYAVISKLKDCIAR